MPLGIVDVIIISFGPVYYHHNGSSYTQYKIHALPLATTIWFLCGYIWKLQLVFLCIIVHCPCYLLDSSQRRGLKVNPLLNRVLTVPRTAPSSRTNVFLHVYLPLDMPLSTQPKNPICLVLSVRLPHLDSVSRIFIAEGSRKALPHSSALRDRWHFPELVVRENWNYSLYICNNLLLIFFSVALQSFWTLAASHVGGFLSYLDIW
jgi:hypothetical protein